jgi:hypothetical protein
VLAISIHHMTTCQENETPNRVVTVPYDSTNVNLGPCEKSSWKSLSKSQSTHWTSQRNKLYLYRTVTWSLIQSQIPSQSTSVRPRNTGCLKKELYSDIPNVAVWRMLRKHLHLNEYKLYIVQHQQHERWIVCTPLSVNVFLTPPTQHLKYHCKLLETP